MHRAHIVVQPRARVVEQEALHVLDLGAAPAVDGLVVVADHEHAAAVAGEQAHEAVLDRVGVLEFVDQDFAEAMPVMREQRRVVATARCLRAEDLDHADDGAHQAEQRRRQQSAEEVVDAK